MMSRELNTYKTKWIWNREVRIKVQRFVQFVLHSFLFTRILFFRPRLNVLIFLPIQAANILVNILIT